VLPTDVDAIQSMRFVPCPSLAPLSLDVDAHPILPLRLPLLRVLVEGLDQLGIDLASTANIPHARVSLTAPLQIEDDVRPPPLALAITALWSDDGIQLAFARSNEIQLNDSSAYYFESIETYVMLSSSLFLSPPPNSPRNRRAWADQPTRSSPLLFCLPCFSRYRIAANNYVPSDQDILRSRVKSTGIQETVRPPNLDPAYAKL
jgi:guanine nucleotide-binding protein G(i) subunit alpha